jgi:uncharacterized protein
MPGTRAIPSAWRSPTARIRIGATATSFSKGREAIKAFLRRKWAKELDYRLKKELWCWTENRIAVTFQYEWHNPVGHWFCSYGNELWEFDEQGLMKRRIASINDVPIAESDRKFR